MKIKKYLLSLSLLLVVVVSASAVVLAKGETKAAAPTEIIISAAASLQDSLLAIEKEFEMKNPSIKLTFNFAASGILQKQIEQGAPSDVFISAGSKQMKALVDGGYVDSANQTPLLANDLVMIMPIDSKIKLAKETNKELTKPEFKLVAIGIPESVPAGMYAKQTLDYLGIYEELKPKLVQTKDVRQVLTYVETGNADAGFVYRTDALTSKKVKIMLTVAPKAHDAIIYPEGIVKETKHLIEATSFYNYLQGKEATAIFVKYGFKLPSKP
ncbi:molybdate ABC transporter substrate-binding protein [Paenibacillus psychroresistens]|uniref:Molybdate ABC transporter substrate-binding protein n=1 Tax=Paenibacillus psychroresistens TaxID=1778678 RepID=A0A6B8RUA9_9BACL|nr:molybdate ABC transporter substrate-binding protein [Paenibacillus psychroresistens]QGQ99527.1 molybdate ABC transporter substrate-binding protein [Paenibacillus psychroresistens]